MKLTMSGIGLTVFLAAAPAFAELKVTRPSDGTDVCTEQRIPIEGTGATGDKVWLVVEPVKVGGFWVQEPANAISGGRWFGGVYLGRPGQDYDQQYRIFALQAASPHLEVGKALPNLPQADEYASPVTVTKKQSGC